MVTGKVEGDVFDRFWGPNIIMRKERKRNEADSDEKA
jgi:hypothetical protein